MARVTSMDFEDGKYTGEVNSSKLPHGHGTLEIPYLDCTYEGDFKNGKMTGWGVMTWKTGTVYEGDFVDGRREGYGKMTYSDGGVQDGEWDDDLFVGESSSPRANEPEYEEDDEDEVELDAPSGFVEDIDFGDGKYTGQVNSSKTPHGRGKLVISFLDATYDGEFVNGEMTGRGMMTWGSGAVYNGFFQNGMRHGYGQMTFPDGIKKFGDWKDDLFEGECSAPADFVEDLEEALSGTEIDDEPEYEEDDEEIFEEQSYENDDVTIEYDGGIYTGPVKNGLPHGTGKLRIDELEFTYEGEFVDGKAEGYGKKTWDSGDCCEGTIIDGLFCGNGYFFFADGDTYEGEFKDDSFEGKGKFTYVNGDTYEGEFANDSFEGKGKFTWANGNTYEGNWKEEEWCGSGTFTVNDGGKKISYFSSCWDGNGSAEVVLRDDGESESDGSMKDFKFTPDKAEDRYEGEKNFKGLPHGKGKMYYADGSIYDGGWAYGKWYREGTYTDPEGNVYKGSFLSTKQSLNITLIKDGRSIHGTMDNGVFHAN